MGQLPQIDILLATYNGERFVEEQIHSLLEQTYPHWRLIIRDDGSTDETRAIIRHFKEQYPEKIDVIEDNLTNLGACRNFGKLLEYSNADYTMFCDQDDVWLPRKIEVTLGKIQRLEERYGSDRPLLVYTDMYVVDDALSIISDSFWRHQAFNPLIGKSLSRFLVSNVATGCTVIINKKLRELSVPFPDDVLMHDWWVGLISVALGENDYLEEPTLFYRQHAMNVAGAKWDMGMRSIGKKLREFNKLRKINRDYLKKTQNQASIFASRYRKFLSEKDYGTVAAYANLSSQNFFQKRFSIIRYGFWWAGFVRSLTMFIII